MIDNQTQSAMTVPPAAVYRVAPAGLIARNCRSGFAKQRRPRPAAASTPTLPYAPAARRSEEHTSELQSLMRISYAVFCLKNKNTTHHNNTTPTNNQKTAYT